MYIYVYIYKCIYIHVVQKIATTPYMFGDSGLWSTSKITMTFYFMPPKMSDRHHDDKD